MATHDQRPRWGHVESEDILADAQPGRVSILVARGESVSH